MANVNQENILKFSFQLDGVDEAGAEVVDTFIKDTTAASQTIGSLMGQDGYSDYFEALSRAQGTMQAMANSAKSMVTSMGSAFDAGQFRMYRDSFMDMMRTAERIRGSINDISHNIGETKRDKINERFNVTSAMSGAGMDVVESMGRVAGAAKGLNKIGFKQQEAVDFARRSQSIVRDVLGRAEAKDYDQALSALWNDKSFQRMVKDTYTAKGSVAPIPDSTFVKLAQATLAFGNHAQGRSNLMAAPFKAVKVNMSPADLFPEFMRSAYNGETMATPAADVRKLIDEKTIKERGDLNSQVYNSLITMATRRGKENTYARDLLLKAGVIDFANGKIAERGGAIVHRGSIPLDVARWIGSQAFSDAAGRIAGSPQYFKNKNDVLDRERMREKSGANFEQIQEVMEALALDKNIGYIPKAGEHEQTAYEIYRDDAGAKYAMQSNLLKDDKGRYVYAAARGQVPAFATPHAHINPETGKIQYTKNITDWRKTNGVKEQREDEVVMQEYSQMLYMLGYNPEHENTWGEGRDAKTLKPTLTKATPLVTMDISTLYGRDEKGQYTKQLDTKLANTAARQISGKLRLGYDKAAGDYEVGWIKATSDTMAMVESGLKQSIDKRFHDAGMPSPFEAFNVNGTYYERDYAKTTKQRNAVSYMATPGQSFAHYGQTWSQDADKSHVALIDEEAMYKLFQGLNPTDSRGRKNYIDAGSLFMPGTTPMEGQMRGAVAKFMGQEYDWKLQKEHEVFERDTKGNFIVENGRRKIRNGVLDNNPFLEVDENDKLHFYLPGFNAIDAIAKKIGRDADKIGASEYLEFAKSAEGMAFLSSPEFRSQYMTDVMGEDINQLLLKSSVKNEDKFSKLSSSMYEKMFGKKAPTGGTVQLSANEANAYYQKALSMLGGNFLVHSTEDFDITRDEWVESLTNAFGIPASAIARQNQEYIAELEDLKTTSGQIAYLERSGYYRKQANQNGMDYFKSGEAQRQIQQRVEELQRRISSGSVKIGGDNVMSKVAKMSLGSMATLMGMTPETAPTGAWKSMIGEGAEDYVYIEGDTDFGDFFISRQPAAPGQYKVLKRDKNTDRIIQMMASTYGGGKEGTGNAIYISPQALDELNTGDFDGDAVWAMATQMLGTDAEAATARARQIKDSVDAAWNRVDPTFRDFVEGKGDTKKPSVKDVMEGTANKPGIVAPGGNLSDKEKEFRSYFGLGLFDTLSKQTMGGAVAVMRNAMQTTDDDAYRWMAIAQASKIYDLATSDMKKKGLTELDNIPMEYTKFLGMGSATRRVFHEVENILNDDTGLLVPTKDTLLKGNVPSINDPNALGVSLVAFRARRDGKMTDDTSRKDLEDIYNRIGYDPTSAEGMAIREYLDLMSDAATGVRVIRGEDTARLRKFATAWESDIGRRGGAALNKEEYARLQKFGRRIDFAESGKAQNEASFKALATSSEKALEDMKIRDSAAYGLFEQRYLEEEREELARKRGETYTPNEEAVAAMKAIEDSEELRSKYNTYARYKFEGKAAKEILEADEIYRNSTAYNAQMEIRDKDREKSDILAKMRRKSDGLFVLPETFKARTSYSALNAWFNPEGSAISAFMNTIRATTDGSEPAPSAALKIRNLLGREAKVDLENPFVDKTGTAKLDQVLSDLYGESLSIADTPLGKAIHTVMETSAKQEKFNSSESEFIVKNLEKLLSSEEYTKEFAQAGVKYNADTHTFSADGSAGLMASDATIKRLNEKLKVVGGKAFGGTGGTSLKAFMESIITAGEKIVQVESDVFDTNGTLLKTARERVEFPLEKIGEKKQSAVQYASYTIAPDLVTEDAQGALHVYDYKSSAHGSTKSLAQSLAYIALAKQDFEKQGNASPFTRWFDKDGKLRIKDVTGYDFTTGTETTLSLEGNEGLLTGFVDEIRKAALQKIGDYSDAKDIIERALSSGDFGELFGAQESSPVIQALMKKSLVTRNMSPAERDRVKRLWEVSASEVALERGTAANITSASGSIDVANQAELAAANFAFGQMSRIQEEQGNISSNLWKAKRQHEALPGGDSDLLRLYKDAAKLDAEAMKNQDIVARYANAITEATSKTGSTGMNSVAEVYHEVMSKSGNLVQAIADEISGSADFRMSRLEHRVSGQEADKEQLASMSRISYLSRLAQTANAEAEALFETFGLSTETDQFGNKKRVATATRGATYASTVGASDKVANRDKVIAGEKSAAQFVNDTFEEVDGKTIITSLGKEHETYLQMKERADKLSQDVDEEIKKEQEAYSKNLAMRSEGLFGAYSKMNVLSSPERYAQLTAISKEVDAEIDAMNQDLLKTDERTQAYKSIEGMRDQLTSFSEAIKTGIGEIDPEQAKRELKLGAKSGLFKMEDILNADLGGLGLTQDELMGMYRDIAQNQSARDNISALAKISSLTKGKTVSDLLAEKSIGANRNQDVAAIAKAFGITSMDEVDKLINGKYRGMTGENALAAIDTIKAYDIMNAGSQSAEAGREAARKDRMSILESRYNKDIKDLDNIEDRLVGIGAKAGGKKLDIPTVDELVERYKLALAGELESIIKENESIIGDKHATNDQKSAAKKRIEDATKSYQTQMEDLSNPDSAVIKSIKDSNYDVAMRTISSAFGNKYMQELYAARDKDTRVAKAWDEIKSNRDLTDSEKKFIKKYKLDYGHAGYASYEDMFKARTAAGSYGLEGSIMGNAYKTAVYTSLDDIRADQLRELEAVGPNAPGYKKANIVNKYAKIMQNSQDYLEGSLEAQLANLTGVDLSGNKPIGMSEKLAKGEYDLKSTKLINNLRENLLPFYEKKEGGMAELEGIIKQYQDTIASQRDRVVRNTMNPEGIVEMRNAEMEAEADTLAQQNYRLAMANVQGQHIARSSSFGKNFRTMLARQSVLGYGFTMTESAREQAQYQLDQIAAQEEMLNAKMQESNERLSAADGYFAGDAERVSRLQALGDADLKRLIGDRGTNIDINGTSYEAISREQYNALMRNRNLAREMDVLRAQKGNAQALMGANSGIGGLAKGLGLSMTSLVSRFVGQKLKQAYQLAKQEMLTFDTEMSTIQGITLKSDEEMGAVKQNVVANAKKYKTSISQVSGATAALYRQGLNEEQVNQRLGSVIQLSKVAGIDTNTSNEVITMLLQTGLYSSAESAADAIAALGDAAATTAAQLTKALKKTAVSASEYGVSGGELNALLTAILEDTQLSGNIVGTGVNTILNRLNKVSSGDELVTDENGNTTSTGTIATALRYVGVNLYEGEGQAAKMRNPFDILEDLASGWEQYSDFDKQRISTALGGQGRNATTFLEIMDALGENGVERYRELRQVESESSGVLGEKYDVMTDNVATTIETIKTEWQSIWTDDAAINMLQALLDGFKGFVDIVGEAENPLLALIAPMTILAGLSAMIHGGTAGLVIGAGMVAAGGIGMGVTAIKNWSREREAEELKNTPGTKEYYMAQHEEHQQKYDDYNTLLDRIEATKQKYGDKNYADMTQDEKVQSLNALYEVIDNFDSAEDAASALADFQGGVVSFAETMDRVAREIKERQNKEFEESLTTAMNAYEIEGGYSESFSNYTKNGIKGMSYIVDANGNYRIVQDKVAGLYDEANKYDIRVGDYDYYDEVIDKIYHDKTISNNEAERLTGIKNAMDYFLDPSFRSNSMFTYSYAGNDAETLDDYVNMVAAEKVGDLSEPILEDLITGPLNIPETLGPKLGRLSLDEWLANQGLPSSTSSPFYRAEPKAPEPIGELPELSPNYDPEVIQRAYDTIANNPYVKYGLTGKEDDTLPMYVNAFFTKSKVAKEIARMKDLQKQGKPLTKEEQEIVNTTPADLMRSIIDWGNDTSGLVRDKNGEIFTINDMPVNLSQPSNRVAKEFLKYWNVNLPAADENGMYDFGSGQMKFYARNYQGLIEKFSPFINGNFTDEQLAEILEFSDIDEEDYEEALSRISEYERILSENAEIQAEIDRIEGEYAAKTARYQKDIAQWREDIEETKSRFAQRDAAIPLYYSEYLPEMDEREEVRRQAMEEAVAALEKERDFENATIALKNLSEYEDYMTRKAAYAEEQERLKAEIESNMLENYNLVTNDEGQIIGYYNKEAGRESVQGEDKTFYGINPDDDALVKYDFKSTDKTRGEVAEMQKRFIALNDALTNEANKFTREQIYTDYLLGQDVFSTLLTTMGTRLGVTEKRMAEFVSGKINADTEKYFNEDGTANADAIVELFKDLYYNEEETKASYAAETGTQDRIFDYKYTTKDGITYYSDTKDFSGAVYREGEAAELTAEDIEEPIDTAEVRYAKTGIKVSPSLMDMEGILTEEDKGYKTTTDAILEAFKKSKIDGLPTSISKLSDIAGVDIPSLEPYLASNKEAMKILEELIVQENGGKKTAYTVEDFIAAVMKDNGKESLIETEKSAATYATSQYLASETAKAIEDNLPLTYAQMQAVAEYNGVSIDAYRANAAGFNAEYLYGFRSGENQILAGINAETQNYRATLKPAINKGKPVAVAFDETPYTIPEEIQKYIDMGYIYNPETGTFTGIDYSKFSSDDLLAASLELSRMQTAEQKSPLGVARSELTDVQKAMIASEEFRSKYAAYSAAYSGGMSDEVLGYLAEYYKTGRMGVGSGTALLEAYGLGSFLTPLEGGQFAEGQQADMFAQLENLQNTQPEIYALLDSLYGLDAVMKALSSSERVASDGLEDFTDGIKRADLLDKYSEDADKVASAMEAFGKDAQKSAAAMTSLNASMNKVANNRFYRMKFAEGDTEDETIKSIMEQTGLGEEFVKNADNKAAIQAMLNTVDASELLDMQTFVNGLNETLSQEQIDLIGPSINIAGGNVSIDSDMGAQVASMLDPQQQAMIEQLQAYGFAAHWEQTTVGDSVSVKLVLDSLGTGAKTSKSGGGGGGKSAAAKLIEKWKNLLKTPDHMIKMIQAQETKYEQLGELGNLNNMIALENVAQEDYKLNLLDEIEALKEQMGKTKKESDDWYALRDAIFEAEEAYEAANNAIDANNKKMRENQQAIYKTRTDLEDTVKQAIDEADQKERDMLAGTVSMQETILDVIEQRYRDEWDLISKDIDKKREALDEEKSLIDERLQMRKDAEDQARKYEELAEYQRQYALISMDSTRTKDATELLKKINDLQTELAWDTAENEAEAQKEALDDKSEAYSQFQTIASEDLEALLADATNFTVDVNDVLKMSFNDMMQWLSDSVEQFSISLDESQQQMLDSWEDTFRQMKGITGQYGEDLYGLDRTYGEVPNVLETKESFMGRMMQTDQYLNAISDEERWQMLYQWAELYDNWVAAQKNGATYAHDDDWLGLGTNGDAGKTTHGYSYYADGSIHSQTGFATKEEAQAAADAQKRLIAHAFPSEADDKSALTKIISSFSVYKSGGLVDYTGPAWVDGTPMRPEAFLSAEDTAMIRTMIDSLSRVMHNPYMTMINPADFGGSSSTIGDINVTINQAEITDDRSIEDLANRVGEALVDELAKTGFNTGRFSF